MSKLLEAFKAHGEDFFAEHVLARLSKLDGMFDPKAPYSVEHFADHVIEGAEKAESKVSAFLKTLKGAK